MWTTLGELTDALFGHPEAGQRHALWLDGGPEGRHRVTACPEYVARLSVSELPFRSLDSWLRQHLPSDGGDGALYAILLAYDAGRNLERIPETGAIDPVLPDVVIARYLGWFEADGSEGRPSACGSPEATRRLNRWLGEAKGAPSPALPELSLRSSMTQSDHTQALEALLEGIAEGALYQANIARRLSAPLSAEHVPTLYRQLRETNPAPFGALWALDPETWLASNSPECLLTWEPSERRVHSFPIKGTRPRGSTDEEDHRLAEALGNDRKERAEHLMIVDLVRNDLGRIAEPGSVRVDDLFGVSSWTTVHHMVSDVHATARADVDLIDILLALFPGGSITGAPKIAAMHWIERLEGLRRGFYCGSLGVIGPTGEATFNILIRTCVAAEGRLFYQSGGGIVSDSDPLAEWRETEVKASALLRALGQST